MRNRKIIPSNMENIREALKSGLRIKIERVPSTDSEKWIIDTFLDEQIDIQNVHLSKLTDIDEIRSVLVFDHIEAGAVLSINQDDISNFIFYFYPTRESEKECYQKFSSKAIEALTANRITGYIIEKDRVVIKSRPDGFDLDYHHEIDSTKSEWLEEAINYLEELYYSTIEIQSPNDLEILFRDDVIEIQLANRSVIKRNNDYFNVLLQMNREILYKICWRARITIKGDTNA